MSDFEPNSISVRSIIAAWPSRAALAEDMSVPTDPVTVERVNGWAKRGTIPSEYHARILRAALARSIPLTADQIIHAHDSMGDGCSDRGEAA